MKIKILGVNKEIARGMLDPIYRAENQLHELGFDIVDNKEDISLFQIYSHLEYNKIQDFINKSYSPIILLDASASAGYNWFEFLSQDKIIGYIKKQLYKDKNLYKVWWPRMRYHYYLGYYQRQGFKPTKNLNIIDEMLNKVHLGWNLGLMKREGMNFIREKEIKKEQKFDIHMSMTITSKVDIESKRPNDLDKLSYHTPDEAYNYHRVLWYENIQKIVKKHKLKISNSNVFGQAYYKQMEESKITLNPWGKGETCFRFFEAISNGSCPITPNMEHLITWPYIYTDNITYKSTDINCKTLEKDILELLENYNMRRQLNKNTFYLLNQGWNNEFFANHFKSIMEKILQ